MIAFLQGTVIEKTGDAIILDVGGVGFYVLSNTPTIARAGAAGEKLKLYTHMIVREDAMDICGFYTKEECQLFKKLLGVSGVGAKNALALLSRMSVSDFSIALVAQDAKAIAKTPGLGMKTAQKIILELKDKVTAQDFTGNVIGADTAFAQSTETSFVADAIEALMALGYPSAEAAKAVNAVKNESGSADELVRLALRKIAF